MVKSSVSCLIGLFITLLVTYNSAAAQAVAQYPPQTGSTLQYSLSSATEPEATVVGVTEIRDSAIMIPETVSFSGQTYNVVGIAESAINGGDSLISVVIPQTVSNLSQHAFAGCTMLKSIVILNPATTVPGGYSQSAFKNEQQQNVFDQTATLYVSNQAVDNYRSYYPDIPNIGVQGTLNQILSSPTLQANTPVSFASGDLTAVQFVPVPGNTNGFIYVRSNSHQIPIPTPASDQIDFMSNHFRLPYTKYSKYLWASLFNQSSNSMFHTVTEMQNWVGHVIEGTLNAKYGGETFYFSGNDKPVVGDESQTPLNIYTLAALRNSSITAPSGEKYYFVQPENNEVGEIILARWDGRTQNFVLGEMMVAELGTITPTWEFYMFYNTDFSVAGKLQDGAYYRFKALFKRNTFIGAPATDGNYNRAPVEGGNYTVYPLNLTPESVTTGITDVVSDASSAVVATEYIDASGRVSDKPFNGLNIIRHHHANGSVTTSKQMIR